MADKNEIKTTTIIIAQRSAVGVDREVTFGINGVTQTVPVGVPVEVREDLLEALDNSDRTYAVVDTGSSAAGAAAAGGSPAGDSAGQEDAIGGRMGANDRIAPHVDKDTTGFHYAADAGAFKAEGDSQPGEVDESAPPLTPLTPEEQAELNGSDPKERPSTEDPKAAQATMKVQDGQSANERNEAAGHDTDPAEHPAPSDDKADEAK